MVLANRFLKKIIIIIFSGILSAVEFAIDPLRDASEEQTAAPLKGLDLTFSPKSMKFRKY